MAGIKGLNFKSLLVDHGEKIALAGIGLLVLGVWGTTSWSRTEKSPDEIIKKATNSKTNIDAGVWPVEKANEFAIVAYQDRASQLLKPMESVAAYEFSTPLYHPLYRKQEQIKEPEWLPVADLIADAGTAIIAINKGLDVTLAETETGDLTKASEEEVNTEFAIRSGVGGTSAGGPGASGAETPVGSYTPPPVSETTFGGSSPYGLDGSVGGTVSSVEARGVRYVAVRGIVPLQQQVAKLQKALNLQSLTEAEQYLELLDFKLERQEAVAGDNPWIGKWEAVDMVADSQILAESPNFDIDPFDARISDATITAPLPLRLMGYWGEHATHPKVRNFTLSPEERAKQERFLDKVVETATKERALLEQSQKPQRRGFAVVQRDLRALQGAIMSSSSSDQILGTMSTMMAAPGSPAMTSQQLKKMLDTAGGRLLLFRYLDLQVKPGRAYRYRVKLLFTNPNYNLPIEQIVDPSVAAGAERESPWSTISNPAVVPGDVKYFLAGSERDPVRDVTRSIRKAVANMSVYQWDAKLGSLLNSTLDLTSVGQVIKETKKVKRADLGNGTYEDADIVIGTTDLLLDVAADVEVNVTLQSKLPVHMAELGLTPVSGKLNFGLLPEAVVVNEAGQMEFIDSKTNQKQEDELKRRYEGEKKEYEKFKPPEVADPLLGPGGGEESSYVPPGMGDPTARKVSSKKIRTNRKNPPGMGSSPPAP
ncbi:hypothetical protein Spb1_08480 [Planctopirus ephydatiae]|uniref:Uncharacterized protein n=1 Tax=Planctopirus ephydatiae TaxID=2528019 RepID=A0A518GKF6_9PLAN|nr:hypothetical protein [Planctopirus ephydatiae]QDV28981.1 hypothetical protein Spb1_08480 [Planctopirus ephydatiae]